MEMRSVTTEAEGKARLTELEWQDRMREQEEERRRKNPPFVQFTERKMTDLRKHLRNNPLAVEIFMFLSQHMDQTNIVICPMKVFTEEMEKKPPSLLICYPVSEGCRLGRSGEVWERQRICFERRVCLESSPSRTAI